MKVLYSRKDLSQYASRFLFTQASFLSFGNIFLKAFSWHMLHNKIDVCIGLKLVINFDDIWMWKTLQKLYLTFNRLLSRLTNHLSLFIAFNSYQSIWKFVLCFFDNSISSFAKCATYWKISCKDSFIAFWSKLLIARRMWEPSRLSILNGGWSRCLWVWFLSTVVDIFIWTEVTICILLL